MGTFMSPGLIFSKTNRYCYSNPISRPSRTNSTND